MKKTIFIIEDDESIREMIKIALTSFSYAVFAFENAEDSLEAVFENPPNMLIFDIMLPGISGLEATKRIRGNRKTKALPIILLTAKDTELDKVTGLDSGADDYISKPFGVMELAARVRSLLRRTETNDVGQSEDIHISDLSINCKTREVTQSETPVDLTFKEYDLLYMLISNRDRIISREELLSAVWGYDFAGESRTLDMHIRTLRQKINDNAENPKYIKTVRNVGYRFIGD
ncbi:DNA-binding response regulator [Clostridia bacterium]|nr:DNA-binding response regulator [Clostridia bacterium]